MNSPVSIHQIWGCVKQLTTRPITRIQWTGLSRSPVSLENIINYLGRPGSLRPWMLWAQCPVPSEPRPVHYYPEGGDILQEIKKSLRFFDSSSSNGKPLDWLSLPVRGHVQPTFNENVVFRRPGACRWHPLPCSRADPPRCRCTGRGTRGCPRACSSRARTGS